MTNSYAGKNYCLACSKLNRRIKLLEETLMENKRISDTLQNSEKRYRRLFETAKDGILILDAFTGRVVDVNPFLMQLLGYSYDDFCGKHIWDIGAFKDIAASKDAFKVLQDSEYIRYEDLPLETFDGRPVAVEFVSNVYLVDQNKVIQCNIRDITSQKLAKAERKRLMAAIEQAGDAIFITDAQGNIQFVNPAFEITTGYSRDEIDGQNPRFLKSGEQDEQFYSNLWATISGGKTWESQMVNKRKNGTLYTEETKISPVRDALNQIVNYVAVNRDITENLKLAAQFQQVQKMEAVSLMAGGAAHDFNNMLTVILGYAEMALFSVDRNHPVRDDIEEIIKAALLSAGITRQLLAFARKQAIIPVVIDLNQAVESMLKMIQRLMGEAIHLDWLPMAELRPIKMDPAQIDQILVNLCVNARDAINDLGTVIIETGMVVFDETYCAQHAGFLKGRYVLLTVSDNGCGMDKETLGKIFDPYFTSKGLEKGTGLGLSIIYGIVKQNNGFINVYSEPGNGTTFRIYLPSYTDGSVDAPRINTAETPQGRGETVLLVEDEPAILKMCEMVLNKLGYCVLAASTPEHAIELCSTYSSAIHLLITDVVMPGMNGRELAERVRSLCPDIQILFMSGYTANVIAQRGVLEEGASFIQKPFSIKDLAVKMREALCGNETAESISAASLITD